MFYKKRAYLSINLLFLKASGGGGGGGGGQREISGWMDDTPNGFS